MTSAPQGLPLAIPDLTRYHPTAFDLAEGKGFIAATSAYMQSVISTLESFMKSSMENSKTEANIQSSLTDSLEDLSKKVQKEWAEYEANKPTSNWLTKALGYILDGFMLLISVVTADPVLFSMTSTMIVMQASGLQDKLNSVLPSDSGLKALCELGIAAGEALLFGGIDLLSEKGLQKFMEEAAEKAAPEVAKTAGQQAVSALRTYTSLLAQSLLMGGFWIDACKAMGMGDEDAAIFGMIAGVGFGLAATAASMDDGTKALLRKTLFAKWGANAERFLDIANLVLNIGKDIFQIAGGAEQIRQGQMLKIVAGILKKMGVTQGNFSLMQGLLQIWSSASTLTQNTTSSITDDFTAVNQSFPALGQMWRPAHR